MAVDRLLVRAGGERFHELTDKDLENILLIIRIFWALNNNSRAAMKEEKDMVS